MYVDHIGDPSSQAGNDTFRSWDCTWRCLHTGRILCNSRRKILVNTLQTRHMDAQGHRISTVFQVSK